MWRRPARAGRCSPRGRGWLLSICLPACPAAQSPYHTNLLMAGYDEDTGPALYWCDYLATLHHLNICGTGYGGRALPCVLLLRAGGAGRGGSGAPAGVQTGQRGGRTRAAAA